LSRKSKIIEIIGADSDTLEKDHTFPEAYAFYIKLADEPDHIWQKYLAEWKNALNAMQRDITVAGDRLRLVFVYGDDMQNYANYAANLVNLINKRVEEYNKQVELKEKTEMSVQEVEKSKEEELLRKLKGLEPVPSSEVIEITVEELLAAYENDSEAAEAKYGKKTLKIKGVVERIEAKEKLDIYYMILSGKEGNLQQAVRCVFDKKNGAELNKLAMGQSVTVQGKYDGSIVDIRMGNCVLI
jgi:hypothetical protein